MLDEPRAPAKADSSSRSGVTIGRDPARLYNLFPLVVGDVQALATEFPRIAAMGFDWVYLNSVAQAGFSGSLYAVKDHWSLDMRFGGGPLVPALEKLSEAAWASGMGLMVDLVINHTSLDSPLVSEHSHWFARDPSGEVIRPSAIDPADASKVTVWGDLAEIDYADPDARRELIEHWKAYVEAMIRAGVSGFRCDAAYKVPADVWRVLIQAARRVNPNTLFVAETLGCRWEEVEALAPAGFDYLFDSVKWWDLRAPWALEQHERLRELAPSIGFPESHDTPRLAEELAEGDPDRLRRAYLLRYALATVYSAGMMMPVGYEFGWRNRLDVVGSTPDAREAPAFDISAEIAALNRAKVDIPALRGQGTLERFEAGGLTVLRRRGDGDDAVLLVVVSDSGAKTVERATIAGFAGVGDAGLVDITPGHDTIDDRGRFEIPPMGFRLFRTGQSDAAPRPKKSKPETTHTAPHHPDWSGGHRIAIEAVWPELEGGRFPAKQVVGDRVRVWADIFRDGHDIAAAHVAFRGPGDADWRHTRLLPFDNDRWTADFLVDRPGLWRFTIEAWTAAFESWRRDTLKKQAAGQNIEIDLLDGLKLVARALAQADGDDRRVLSGVADHSEILLTDPVRRVMARIGPRPDLTPLGREIRIWVDRKVAGFSSWYEMFPRSQGTDPNRSATFDDCIKRLPEIRDLGFDVVYLVPIHPIGRTNRKGANNSLVAGPDEPGSPYAIGDATGGHDAVHADLGGIDGFRRFRDAVHGYGMEVALDFAIQCSPDHPWLKQHPEWFATRADGTIRYAENPPKKYEDIVNVDFYGTGRQALWETLRDVVLFWVKEGVRIFRVDNPHTKPLPFWEWMIAEVQAQDPGVIFLAEAFTRPKMMKRLAKLGFGQSYTYFTWRNTKAELTEYMTELSGEMRAYYRPNFFANTPDILPHFLQSAPPAAFRIRFLLAALLSGSYGIYNGFELCEGRAMPGKEEYADSEKYQYKVWDWDRPGHIKGLIGQVNHLRRRYAALQDWGNIRFREAQHDQVLFFEKTPADGGPVILAAVLLDPHLPATLRLDLPAGKYRDLLSDRSVEYSAWPEVTLTPDVPGLLLTRETP